MGICKSHFLTASIDFHEGKKNIEEVKFIKEQCANWFEKNQFEYDAINSRISINSHVMYSEGRVKALKNAEELLLQARELNNPVLLGYSWRQINDAKNPFFDAANYPGSNDSVLFYMNKIKDSLNIVSAIYYGMFNRLAGHIADTSLNELKAIGDRWQNPAIELAIYKMKCFPYAVQGNIDSTLFYVRKMNGLADLTGDGMVYSQSEELLAIAYSQSGDYRKNIRELHSLSDQYEKWGVRLNYAHNIYGIGQAHFLLEEYDSSIIYFLKSVDLYQEIEDHYRGNSTKRRLAELYMLTEKFEKAEELYNEVVDWAIEKDEFVVVQIMLGNTYQNLAELYQLKEEYEKALPNYQLSIDNLADKPNRLSEPKIGLMSLYLDMEAIDKADSLHNEMVTGYLSSRLPNHESFYFEEGRLFIAQKKYEKGIESLKTFLSANNGEGITEKNKEANFLIYKAYRSLDKDRNALVAFENYKELEDSINARNVLENVQEIQAEHTISLKESEIERLEQAQNISDLKLEQQDNQLALRNLYIVVLVFAFLFILAISYFFFRQFRLKKENEKREIKEKLEFEKQEALQKAELAEIKNTIFANISHEFRTPLTLIQVPIKSIKERAVDADKQRLDSVLDHTNDLIKMMDNLLDLSKMELGVINLEITIFNLSHFFSKLHANFAPLFREKNVMLYWDVNIRELFFQADKNRLEIVLNNLLKNAFNHVPEGGWVRLAVEEKGGVSISVTNSGEQILEKDLPHIFERYYRADESRYSGAGIGLALSKQITELHGGKIGVNNEQEKQVAFIVDLPGCTFSDQMTNLVPEKEDFGQDQVSIREESSLSELDIPHILVVEDNVEMRELIRDTLKKDFKLSFSDNGLDGEKKAELLQPDLVLSDVMMPQKDGFELLKALKENFNSSHIPVILLTARADSSSRIKGYEQDADDYIAKPFDPKELISRIHNLLRQRRNLHKLFSENPLLYAKKAKCSDLDKKFLFDAGVILEQNFADGSFSVEQFCRALASNRTSVNIKLKALINQSTASYIKNYRLSKAEKMLFETEASISEVYVDCGFNTPQAFNKAFRKKYNCSPSEYRNTLKDKVQEN